MDKKNTAHCQPGFLASLVAVFGEYDISGDLESKRSVSKNVKRVIVHRQYDAATFENDLAILELESPVRYDTHIGNNHLSGSAKSRCHAISMSVQIYELFLSMKKGKKHKKVN